MVGLISVVLIISLGGPFLSVSEYPSSFGLVYLVVFVRAYLTLHSEM